MNVKLPDQLKNKTVGVAVSGGKDSMALLTCLLKEHKSEFKKIVVINVEHGLRGEESLADTAFVKKYCEDLGVKFYGYSVDVRARVAATGESEEEAARNLRYESFFEAVSSNKCDYILTAHHKGDLVESVLFNLLRGCGIKGLSGIPFCTDRAIRPLLYTDKDEIDEYVRVENIPYVTDKTNFDIKYSRNFLRRKIIPELKERFPSFEDGVVRLGSICSDTEDFLNVLANDAVRSDSRGYYIQTSVAKPVFVRAAIIILKNYGVKKDYEYKHAEAAYSLTAKSAGCSFDLKGGVTAINEYDKIRFIKSDKDYRRFEYVGEVLDGEFIFNSGTVSTSRVEPNAVDFTETGALYADRDKLAAMDGLTLRTRRDGDVFKPYGCGTKKLNDYFTDKKVPKSLRDDVPLLAVGNRILCVFGIQISDDVKIDKKTKSAERLFYAR